MKRQIALTWLVMAFAVTRAACLDAQEAEGVNPLRQPASQEPNLAEAEARLAERYDRLELLAGRLSELSRATQPRRARLLRELISKSRERDVAGRFDAIVDALHKESLATAAASQQQLQVDLRHLLELLLQEDRDRQLESQRKRVQKYLAELKKLIRQQRGIKARTEGGDEANQLSRDQQRVAKATQKLKAKIEETEAAKPSAPKENDAAGDASSKSAPGEGEPKPDTPSEPSDDGKPGESGDGKPPSGKKPSSGKGESGSGEPSDSKSSSESQDPSERAVERLKQARKRMKQAIQRLEEAQRDKAQQQQEQALRELEQAKAELERILRQLREEELERMLVLLEARFRRMLAAQIEVYEETKKLDAAQAQSPTHELEIASGRLSRKERQIVRDAERALVLLREDGTSVAFPEAVEQARDDMASVANRLGNVKLGLITQGLEEDVIAALEETLAALQQAIKDLREQQAQQQQGGGEPGEQPLVDQLAELRMIRALQMRINRSTKRYGALMEGEQAVEADLLEALDNLAIRQERVFDATRDLDTGKNR